LKRILLQKVFNLQANLVPIGMHWENELCPKNQQHSSRKGNRYSPKLSSLFSIYHILDFSGQIKSKPMYFKGRQFGIWWPHLRSQWPAFMHVGRPKGGKLYCTRNTVISLISCLLIWCFQYNAVILDIWQLHFRLIHLHIFNEMHWWYISYFTVRKQCFNCRSE